MTILPKVDMLVNSGKTVLLVDDIEATRILLSRILSTHGYYSIMANDGQAAMDILEQQTVDIILSDIMMPGISGIDLCKYCKNNPKIYSIPVILITGAIEPTLFSKCQEVGSDGFLRKPFDPDDLVRLIDKF
jgi:CheY-like chemotaxis protein